MVKWKALNTDKVKTAKNNKWRLRKEVGKDIIYLQKSKRWVKSKDYEVNVMMLPRTGIEKYIRGCLLMMLEICAFHLFVSSTSFTLLYFTFLHMILITTKSVQHVISVNVCTYVRTSSDVRFSSAMEVLLCTYLFLYLGERLITCMMVMTMLIIITI